MCALVQDGAVRRLRTRNNGDGVKRRKIYRNPLIEKRQRPAVEEGVYLESSIVMKFNTDEQNP